MKRIDSTALILLFVAGMKSGVAADRTFTYAYNSSGDLVTIDGPRTDVSDVTTFGYDASNRLNSITNALGHVYAITSFDAAGRPLTVVDPNGSTTTFTYDPRGRLLTRATNGQTTAFTTDAVGNVTTVTSPNGLILTYGYDAANRLTSITDNQGNQILYTLDSAGNTTHIEIRDPGNVLTYTQSQTFDELSRLLSQIGGANQMNSFSYDRNSNLVSATDGNNHTTANAFDALNRLSSQTDPFSYSDQIVYDSLDQAASITDKNGSSTNYTRDKLGNLLQIQSPDAGTITFTYDAAGNVLTRTDSRSITISYAYDALNRLVAIQYPDSTLNVTVTYDQGTYGVGHITSVAVGPNKTYSYAYDINGNLISKTSTVDGISSSFSFQYDGSNDLVRMTYPSGRVVDYTRNNLGRVTDVSVTENGVVTNLINNIAYEPFGPRSSLVFGNGAQWTAEYDLSYRLISQTAGGFRDLAYTHDGGDNITAISDILNPALDKTYAYDSLNRLTDSLMASSFTYTYDPVGNRLTETVNSFTKNYAYQPGSNKIASISPSESFTHDAAGNIVSSGHFHIDYDDLNRIKTVKNTLDNVIADYEYDPENYRVKKVVAATGETTYYHYGFFGNLLAEQDAQGASVIEYVYLEGTPIAMFYSPAAPANQPPVADAGVDQTVTDTDLSGSETVTLDGSNSSDPDGTVSAYEWKEGANVLSTAVSPALSFGVGVHTVLLTVTDNHGASDTDTVVITVNAGSGGSGEPDPSDCVLHYWMNEGSGAVLNDGSGNNNPGSILGSVAWGADYLDFNGMDTSVDVGSGPQLDDLHPFSITAWIYMVDDIPGGFLFYKRTNLCTGYWAFTVSDDGDGLRFFKDLGSADHAMRITDAQVLPLNQWVHVAATYDGGVNGTGVKIYVNGVEATYRVTQSGEDVISDSSCAMGVGGRTFFKGRMKDLRMYHRVITSSEVYSIYENSN